MTCNGKSSANTTSSIRRASEENVACLLLSKYSLTLFCALHKNSTLVILIGSESLGKAI